MSSQSSYKPTEAESGERKESINGDRRQKRLKPRASIPANSPTPFTLFLLINLSVKASSPEASQSAPGRHREDLAMTLPRDSRWTMGRDPAASSEAFPHPDPFHVLSGENQKARGPWQWGKVREVENGCLKRSISKDGCKGEKFHLSEKCGSNRADLFI